VQHHLAIQSLLVCGINEVLSGHQRPAPDMPKCAIICTITCQHASRMPAAAGLRHCVCWPCYIRHVGLWRVAVVDLEVDVCVEPRFRAPRQRGVAGRQSRMLRLLVGDASGARSELCVPYQQR
jgi:hypothetical protein